MPKAAIDKYGNSQAGEGKVGSNPTGTTYPDSVVLAESQSKPVDCRANSHLRHGADGSISAHEPSNMGRRSSEIQSLPGR